MKKQLIRLSVQRALRGNKAQRRTRPFSDVRTAGILFAADDSDKSDAVLALRDELESSGIRTMLMEFREKPAEETAPVETDGYSLKDFSIWGGLRNTGVEEFIGQEFDYLYSADRLLHPAVQYVLAASKAHCRAGISSDESNAFLDVMIQSDSHHREVLRELLSLTKKLQ